MQQPLVPSVEQESTNSAYGTQNELASSESMSSLNSSDGAALQENCILSSCIIISIILGCMFIILYLVTNKKLTWE